MNNSESSSDDISSPPHTAVPSTSATPDINLGHSSNKRKLTRLNQISSSGNVSKRQDTRDQIDLLLLNALSKEHQASPKKESPKIGNELFVGLLLKYLIVSPEKEIKWLVLK